MSIMRLIPKVTLLILCYCMLFTSQVYSQKLLSAGKIKLVEQGVSDKLNGKILTPPLALNTGIVRFEVEKNEFFTPEDVLQWIKSSRFQITGVNFDKGRVALDPDGSIYLRFEFRFLSGQENISRRFQLSSVQDFNTYYVSHPIYNQKIVTYEIQVEEEPQYDRPETGTLSLTLNTSGVEIIVLNQDGEEAERKFATAQGVTNVEIPTGVYQILLRKSGYQESLIEQLRIEKDATITKTISLRSIGSESAKYAVEFIPNVDQVEVTVVQPGGEQLTATAFASFARFDLAEGKYSINVTKDDYRDFSQVIEVSGNKINRFEIPMMKQGKAKIFSIRSTPKGMDVYINGKNVGTTPFDLKDFEREVLNVTLERKDYQSYFETVDFALIDNYELQAVVKPSYIDFEAFGKNSEGKDILINAEVFLVDTADGAEKVSSESLGLTPFRYSNPSDSSYTFLFKAPGYNDIKETLDITDSGFGVMSPKMAKKSGKLTLINRRYPGVDQTFSVYGVTSDADRFVKKDVAALENQELRYGDYIVEISRVGFEPYRDTIKVDQERFEKNFTLTPKSKSKMILLSAVLPGKGQKYWGKTKSGRWIGILTVAALGASAYTTMEYASLRSDYNSKYVTYLEASYETSNAKYAEATDALGKAQDFRNYAGYSLAGLGLIYGINILDVLLTKSAEAIMKQGQNKALALELKPTISPFAIGTTIKLSF